MGVIDKAFRNNLAAKLTPEMSANDVHPLQHQQEGALSAAAQFDLPMGALAEQGFYTPRNEKSRLALELRLLKRRLLRRTRFLRAQMPGDVAGRRPVRQKNLIMVTSTRPAEGKTFTSINLALSLAMEDEIKVLLVDADAPRPKVQAHLGLNRASGLTDLIQDQSRHISDVSVAARNTSLTVLPEGRSVDRAGDLYASADGQRTFNNLSLWQNDQLVIIDAPPVLATTEAVILASIVDEIIFVVEADATPEQAIASAIEELLDVNPNVSLVLNKCLIGAGGSHYGSYSDYYPRGARRSESEIAGSGAGSMRSKR